MRTISCKKCIENIPKMTRWTRVSEEEMIREHHHCLTCNKWQWGISERDYYGYGECFSCAVKRLENGI